MKLQSLRPHIQLARSHHQIRRSWMVGGTVLLMFLGLANNVTASSTTGPNTTLDAQDKMSASTVVAQPTTTPEPTLTPEPPAEPQLRDASMLKDTSLISGEPCAAPCFDGITPGETSWHDALEILEDTHEFTDIDIQADQDDGQGGQVSWKDGAEGAVCCQLVSGYDSIVQLIFLRTAPAMSLGEVIDVHGDPAYVVIQDVTPDQAIFSLIYPDVPMMVYVFVAGAETGELTASSEIIGMMYITEENMELLLQTTTAHVWEGYQSYKDYAESDLAITPIPTLTPAPNQ